MPKLDIIAAYLSAPIEWNQFEQLVIDILTTDDLPRIRKSGGYNDGGVDGYDVSFYYDQTQLERIIQITSQKAQTLKVTETIDKIRQYNLAPKTIIFVFQQPVASPIKNKIRESCAAVGLFCDIRDQSYLISQLSKKNSGIFSRYFESFRKQISEYIDKPDRLSLVSSRLQHSVLLSIATFVLNPHSRIARGTLFQKTVLAVIVARNKATYDEIYEDLKTIINEDITRERILSSLDSLIKNDECIHKDGYYEPTDLTLANVGQVITGVTKSYDNLIATIFSRCRKENNCDQATLGYIENNVRQAMLFLIRSFGPILNYQNISLDDELTLGIRNCLFSNVSPNIGRCTLLSFCDFVENPENTQLLNAWGRTYASLAIRNIDPIGRRWQQATLSRTIIALDTDVVLSILIEELPDHKSILSAAKAFITSGANLLISPYVLEEVLIHFERANITYRKFIGTLNHMSSASVEYKVLHALVRGYYYSLLKDENKEWDQYYANYYDRDKPLDYIKFLLKRRIGLYKVQTMRSIPSEWQSDFDELVSFLYTKEPKRLKSVYRDGIQMKKRVEDDVYMALNLSSYNTEDMYQSATGYLVTNDRLFLKMEEQGAWRQRPNVVILSNSFPQLADIVCGSLLDDKQFVDLMFNPIIASAAQLSEKEMEALITAGVDLKGETIAHIEWSLGPKLHKAINNYTKATNPEDKLYKAADVANEARSAGFKTDSTLKDLTDKYTTVKKENLELSDKLDKTEETLKKVAIALVSGKRSRRRVNHILKEIGLDLSTLENEV